MSFDHNYPQLAIDHSIFSRALESDALDICLDYLRREEIAGPETARLACRLGEKLFYQDRRGDALEKRRALMEAWALFCSAAPGANVVRLAAART